MTVTVYLLDARFQPVGGAVIDGDSLFACVRYAYLWFQQPHWKGVKPTPQSTFLVRPLDGTDPRGWTVRADAALAAPKQSGLFNVSQEAF